MHCDVAYANVRYPTDHDMNNFIHVNITDNTMMWNPNMVDQDHKMYIYSSIKDPIISSMMLEDYIDYQATQNISSLTMRPKKNLLQRRISPIYGELDINRHKVLSIQPLRILEGQISRRVKTRPHQRLNKHLNGYLDMFASGTAKVNIISIKGF